MTETFAGSRYRIERELGRGGMAGVYLARDEELHRPVAVKVLAEHLGDDETFRARFLREARLAGRLSHQNIVQVYDAGETDGRPFIVMEYVPGGTLAECGRLPAPRAVELGLQACAGLQHAHSAGLVHRDVKPANLLLREDGGTPRSGRSSARPRTSPPSRSRARTQRARLTSIRSARCSTSC